VRWNGYLVPQYVGGYIIGIVEGVRGTSAGDPQLNGGQGRRESAFTIDTYLQAKGGIDVGGGVIIASGSVTLEAGSGGTATIVAGPRMAVGAKQMVQGAAKVGVGTLLAQNAKAVLKIDMEAADSRPASNPNVGPNGSNACWAQVGLHFSAPLLQPCRTRAVR
jgi:hypothetical protein